MKLSDVRLYKCKGKDYSDGNLVGVSDMNFKKIAGFKSSLFYKKDDFEKSCRLTRDNRNVFKDLFGKCSFVFSGSHYFRCWAIQLKTTKLLMLTAKDHGTSYELITEVGDQKQKVDEDEVIEFYRMLMGMLPNR